MCCQLICKFDYLPPIHIVARVSVEVCCNSIWVQGGYSETNWLKQFRRIHVTQYVINFELQL